MKQAFYLTILLLSLGACNKALNNKTFSKELTGKWDYNQSFYSIGGPLIYTSTENLHQWINFKADGTFASSFPAFQQITNYEVLDSIKVKLINLSTQSASRYFYSFDANRQILTMSPADNICIEGCGWKFKRD